MHEERNPFCLTKFIDYLHMSFFITDTSDSQAAAQVASLEEDSSQNAWDDITDHELSVDITDGASSPNQITSSVPSLTPEEE